LRRWHLPKPGTETSDENFQASGKGITVCFENKEAKPQEPGLSRRQIYQSQREKVKIKVGNTEKMGMNMQLDGLLLFQQPTSHDVGHTKGQEDGRKVESLTYMSLKLGESSDASQRGPPMMMISRGEKREGERETPCPEVQRVFLA
jgi:hypothetical protein